MWNARYDQPEYVFGTDPARFLVEQKQYLKPGLRALAVADGEGRNSVFMASKGLEVSAFDGSDIAVRKARALAEARGVSVNYNHADIEGWDWAARSYDLVVAIYIQFSPPGPRKAVFAGLKQALAPGGVLLVHGYRPEQLEYGTGGPPFAENMYTEALLREAFGDLEILRLAAYDREVEEGRGHSGMSALIDLVARKPK